MPYLLLVQEKSEARRARSTENGRIAMDSMLAFAEGLRSRGILIASDSLKSDASGVRVEIRDGRRSLLDGPFTESKEIVGGFFLIDCDSREQALAIACECPAAAWATIEVRQSGPCYED
ncbi:YciI family protein [Hydrocarboniphaga sp.]|uniref:YciI family protein n=1 Tax=Hydrocarboniphaga sp. TaxID=2033016 RepID=UPI0026309ED9|nr:YciI family protein [Hydrocarboniphaga sp.]